VLLNSSLLKRGKKEGLKRNGHSKVKLKTLHGEFEFRLQKFLQDDKSVNYFDLTRQLTDRYVSPRLQELSAYYSNRMSYKEVEYLVERVTGERLLSDQSIWQIVKDKAVQVCEAIKSEVQATLVEPIQLPAVNPEVDIYESQLSEILLLEDGIQVKAQKAHRIRQSLTCSEEYSRAVVNTDVALLQLSSSKFAYMSALIDSAGTETVSLARVVQTRIIQEYGKMTTPLNIVVISDGAKAIRSRLLEIFGKAITVILDWYHLSKKLRSFMSMIARNKAEKLTHLRELFPHLWHGRVDAALNYLRTKVQHRNADKLAELVGYLEKHRIEIIDYERRKQAGKSIGSGRIEKGVDQVIGCRQKKKGMSWRPKGSKSLAILKILELNGQWQHTWFATEIA
jgi:hypothetical protein